EDVDCVGFQEYVQPKLPVAANTGLLSHHLVHGVDQVEGTTETLPLCIGQLGIQQRMGYSVERGAHRQSSAVVSLFGDKVTSGRGVIAANEIVYQSLLFGP